MTTTISAISSVGAPVAPPVPAAPPPATTAPANAFFFTSSPSAATVNPGVAQAYAAAVQATIPPAPPVVSAPVADAAAAQATQVSAPAAAQDSQSGGGDPGAFSGDQSGSDASSAYSAANTGQGASAASTGLPDAPVIPSPSLAQVFAQNVQDAVTPLAHQPIVPPTAQAVAAGQAVPASPSAAALISSAQAYATALQNAG